MGSMSVFNYGKKTVTLPPDECERCASLDMYLSRQPMMLDNDGNVTQYVAECNECGTRVHRTSRIAGSSTEKRSFERCSKKELEEMLVALELLLEHPSARAYVLAFQEDLQAALASKK